MNIFDGLSLAGGLALFLLGMNLMGTALEKKAGTRLKSILEGLTDNPIKGLLLGLAVTAVIQSSSATTVMVVGFVSAGVMSLHQSIYIIMGANIGTTVTAWILSLAGIDGTNLFVQMLKPTSFTPILALVGIVLYLFTKRASKRNTGMIFLGFAVLMTGMSGMSDAVAGLKDVPAFGNILLLFSNPILGVLAGALLTAIIQSSSASVGILQALASTGAVTYGVSIPIIMGQNIGTCVTALLASTGATRDARRTAMVHLYFNIIGSIVLLALFYGLNAVFRFAFIALPTNALGIAIVHTAFNLLCTLILIPFGRLLEKLACLTVPDTETAEEIRMLDERLLAVPTVAVERCRVAMDAMAGHAIDAIRASVDILRRYDGAAAQAVRDREALVDRFEDRIGAFLVQLSKQNLTENDSLACNKYLRTIGELERISDHAVNLVESAEEIREKRVVFSDAAKQELETLWSAISEILTITNRALVEEDGLLAQRIEPLEQVIDGLRDTIKRNHFVRLQNGACTITHGFILADILTDLERVSDHCSNIAVCVQEMSLHRSLGEHGYVDGVQKNRPEYRRHFEAYRAQYHID